MKLWTILVLLLSLAVWAPVTSAHHSIAGVYDESQRVTLDGTIARFQFVNPHPYLVLDVRDAAGRAQQWTLEMDNRSELVEIGFDDKTLKAGERVVVVGSPARNQQQSLYIRRLDRPADGFNYQQVGNRPVLGPRSQPR